MKAESTTRRGFVKSVAGAVAVGTLGADALGARAFDPGKKMIGIQAGAVSFVDEGVEQVLDVFQQRAYINTIFLAVFTYGRGIAGRQVPGQPLPDHGKQEYDTSTFHGGNYATPHPKFYKETPIDVEKTKAPDFGPFDIIDTVLPAAHKRGMKVICWLEDVWRGDVPGLADLCEVNLDGSRAGTLCFNHPGVRAWWEGLVADYAASYEVDGIMWGCERQGPFSNALGSSHGGGGRDPMKVTCFCQFCAAKAKQQGLDFSRVRTAFEELAKFVRTARASSRGEGGDRPVDGYYVSLWRLMLNYPELLAWEHFWHNSLRETYRAIYSKVKSVKRELPVGWHIWHNNSFSPIYRAEQDLAELSKYSDFLKMVMYHNCGGPRIASYVDSVGGTIYGDLPKDELLQFHYRVLNYDEAPYRDVRKTGLKRDYVWHETKRAVAAAMGTRTLIWPGIDIDIPTDPRAESRSTPEDVKAAVKQALQAGAHGVLLSRKYSEMRLANLSGAGAAIKELGYG